MTETYQNYGINLPMDVTGQCYITCPQCSSSRKKSKDKCLGIDTERQIWNCNHCGWSGSLKNRLEVNMQKNYTKPNWKPNGELPEKVIEYFAKRRISEPTLRRNDIQYQSDVYFPQLEKKAGAICFPYKQNGEVVNVKYRSGDKHFIQEKNAEKIFFGLDGIGKNETNLIITEGEIDQLSFEEIDYNFAVSVPDGAPAQEAKNYASKFEYLENCQDLLESMEQIILAVDNDPAGKVLENELARRIGYEKCWYVEYPDGCKDANEVLLKYGKDGLIKLIGTAKPFPILGVIQVEDLHRDLIDLYQNGFKKVYSTGWTSLDEHYKVRPGELTVVTGFPSHGKSEFMDALLINLARDHDWSFGVCSLENLPYERHLRKLAEKVDGKPFFKGENPRMSESDLTEAESFLNDRFYFINPEKIDVDSVLSIAKSLIFRKGIKGLIIDPYNEIDHKRPSWMSETEYISQFLSKMRRFAKLNNVCVWVVAHPTKPLKEDRDKTPTVYDISGSANWANKADNALSIFRHLDDNLVEIHIQKIRFKECGKIGSVMLIYDNLSGRYQDKPQAPQNWNNVQPANIKKAKK